VTTEVTSKTTFSGPSTRRGCDLKPYDPAGIANLMETVAVAMAIATAEEAEKEVRTEW
jgi:hypothetical protein